jgi:deoxyribodipyrimidine photolyase-related protein
VVSQIKEAGILTFGNIDEKKFSWPTSREQSLQVLDYFCHHLLKHFGDYEDAMHTDEKFYFIPSLLCDEQ